MYLSIVVPIYNESQGLQQFHDLLLSVVKKVTKSYEIIYVNDGSRDNSLDILHSFANKNKRIRIINLSRNFGKEIATTAGIHAATGEATIIMDGDGQHPPQVIPQLIDKWKHGAQVVVGVRLSNQQEGLIKKYGSKAFYRLFNSFSGITIVPQSTDYRLIDSVVREEFKRFTERHRITRGLIDWLGFKRDYVQFDSPPRIAGVAGYSTAKLIKLALNSFISLSLKPLFFIAWAGVLITILALFLGIFVFVEQFLLNDPLGIRATGSAFLGIMILFFIGIILTSQGVIAVYLSHVHSQTQERPLFVIDEKNSVNL